MRTCARPHNAPRGMPYTPQEQPPGRDDDNGAALQDEKTKRTSAPLPVTRDEHRFCELCGAATESRDGGGRVGGRDGGKKRTMGVKEGRRGAQLSQHSSFRERSGATTCLLPPLACPYSPFSLPHSVTHSLHLFTSSFLASHSPILIHSIPSSHLPLLHSFTHWLAHLFFYSIILTWTLYLCIPSGLFIVLSLQPSCECM